MGWLSLAIGTAVGISFGCAGGRAAIHGAAGQRKLHQRGAIVAEQPQRPALPDRAASGMAISPDRQVTLAGSAIPIADETKHFKLIGTTGTGKSTAIHEILEAALARGDRAVVADPDAGYVNAFSTPAAATFCSIRSTGDP